MISSFISIIKSVRLRCDSFYYKLLIHNKGENCHFQHPINFIGNNNISLGNNVFIMAYSTIAAYSRYRQQLFSPSIEIGDDVTIGERAHITSINKIIIGKGVLLGKSVTITDNSHGKNGKEDICIRPAERQLISKGAVIIGEKCWLGDKVTVCPGVTIGDGCVIGANSVVTKNLPSYTICAGNPCKIIKYIKNNEE